jgi:hypothetical protein
MDKRILSFSILAVAMALPIAASAQTTLGSMAETIAGVILGVGLTIVVIAWVVTAVLFLMSTGDPSKLGQAKVALFAAIGGTIIMLLANGAKDLVANSFGIH